MAGQEEGNDRLDREAALIREQLAAGDAAGEYQFEIVRVEGPMDLVRALVEHDPVIIHLAGPGGELALDGGAISPEALGDLFARAEASNECVLLNAFFSLERADALLDYARCVVGTRAAVPG